MAVLHIYRFSFKATFLSLQSSASLGSITQLIYSEEL